MIQVRIQREDCTSCSTCWETCPAVFEQNDDDSFSQIVEQYRVKGNIMEGSVPDDLKSCAEDAAASCPVSIITVEEG